MLVVFDVIRERGTFGDSFMTGKRKLALSCGYMLRTHSITARDFSQENTLVAIPSERARVFRQKRC